MVVDPALRRAIVQRIVAGRFGDVPGRAVENLGVVALPDGGQVALHLRHAADAILLDACDQVVLITRVHNPGVGRLALPGGFLDMIGNAVEHPLRAAMREAAEETGIEEDWLTRLGAAAVGARRYDRPFDIREAWNDIPDTAIRKGDLFGVSTQGFRFRLPGDLRDIQLRAGDDAAAVRVMKIADLSAGLFAVPDHLEMIRQVMAG
jgi:ADP-ribose pyrophosphatase YjhB (NUDIX family)